MNYKGANVEIGISENSWTVPAVSRLLYVLVSCQSSGFVRIIKKDMFVLGMQMDIFLLGALYQFFYLEIMFVLFLC